MSCNVGLSIGETFAELIGLDPSGRPQLGPTRWFLPRKSLTDGLREALGEQAQIGGTITVISSLAARALARRLGSTPAFLVTTGFEQWPTLRAPMTPRHASHHPKRADSPLSDDHVFGISERIRADGSIETPLADAELEFLAAKLDLLKVKTVAIGLLHSDLNSGHERRAREFFVTRGFDVFCSHEFVVPGETDELSRWMRAAHAAYASSALKDQKQQIEDALGETKTNWSILFVASSAAGAVSGPTPSFESTYGLGEALSQIADFHVKPARNPTRTAAILHFGLERFVLIQAGRALSLAGTDDGLPGFMSVKQKLLDVQPSSAIGTGIWPAPVIVSGTRGTEAGAMAFGKSLKPTIFDILFALGRLEPIEGVTTLATEKTKPRVLEALSMLSREIETTRVDPLQVAADLETSMLEAIASEVPLNGLSGEIVLTGALARSLHPRLESRRPDLRFRLSEQSQWSEALAAARFARPSPGVAESKGST